MWVMNGEDFVYAIIIIASFLLSLASRQCNGLNKEFFFLFTGLSLVTITSGRFVLYSLITILGNTLIIKLLSHKVVHICSTIWCFGFLAFFRVTHLIGLEKPPSHSNGLQLFLTLKMIGLAYEIHDSAVLTRQVAAVSVSGDDRSDDETVALQDKLRHKAVSPSVLSIMAYAYCHVGLYTGPYYKYSTFRDMIRYGHKVQWMPPFRHRVWHALVSGLTYLAVSNVYYIQYAKTEEFYAARSLAYRFYYMFAMFFVFRMRVYFAWITGECVAMCAGLGAYPVAAKARSGEGPTDYTALRDIESRIETGELSRQVVSHDFACVDNVCVRGCEVGLTVREGMRSWNMTVQYWLAAFVYHRVPNKSIRVTVTMAVSAFWHGVHPGYYLSFLTVPPALALDAVIRRRLAPPTAANTTSAYTAYAYTAAAWAYRSAVFAYCAMGFLLLGAGDTLRYWASVHFCVHLLVSAVYALDFVLPKCRPPATTTATPPNKAE